MNKNFTVSSELEQLKAKLFVKADGVEQKKEGEDALKEELMSRFESLYSYITYLEKRLWEISSYNSEWQYKHQEGHLPKLQAGGIEKLLKAAGEDQNFSVQKRIIYAADKHSQTAIVDLSIK